MTHAADKVCDECNCYTDEVLPCQQKGCGTRVCVECIVNYNGECPSCEQRFGLEVMDSMNVLEMQEYG